ncbi:hypothetical protein F4814DRAFT_454419 [Daldinia grandis]|nr:hypothetical protein F4814DRAFT_454419 [Daldinia grandis]
MFNLSIFDRQNNRHRASQNRNHQSSRNTTEFSPRQYATRPPSSEYDTARSGQQSTQYDTARSGQQSTQYDTGRSRQQSTEYGTGRSRQTTAYETATSVMDRLRVSWSPSPPRDRTSSRGNQSSSTRNPVSQTRHPLGLRETLETRHRDIIRLRRRDFRRHLQAAAGPHLRAIADLHAMNPLVVDLHVVSLHVVSLHVVSLHVVSLLVVNLLVVNLRMGLTTHAIGLDHRMTLRLLTKPHLREMVLLPPLPPPPPPPSPPPRGGPSPPESDSSDSEQSDHEPASPYGAPPPRGSRPPTAFNLLEREQADNREILRQRSRTEGRNIRGFFQRDERNFQYLGIAGHGANSVAVKVKLRSRWFRRHYSQTFVVKRAIVAGVQRKLRSENRTLRLLRGAKHIVQLYRTSGIRNPIDRARGRTVIMEWIPNGTLGSFITRLARSRDHQSNRMLHILFMCLIRMCIAMAFPPRKGRRAMPLREVLPDSRAVRERKTQLVHYDMHTHNILFGDIEPPGDNDHYVLPPLKLIDFEDAEILSGSHRHNQAVQSNIFGIGMIMRCIIMGTTDMNARAAPVRITISGLNVTITSYANFPSATYGDIDGDLRALVIQCCAANPQERPTLEDLYARARGHLRNREYDYYRNTPTAHYERKPWMTRLVQQYILNADST